jgi:hypothetical protein
MFVLASVIMLLVEALVLVLLLVGALHWFSFFFLRQPRPRCSGPDPTIRGRAEVRGFPRRPYTGSKFPEKAQSRDSGE